MQRSSSRLDERMVATTFRSPNGGTGHRAREDAREKGIRPHPSNVRSTATSSSDHSGPIDGTTLSGSGHPTTQHTKINQSKRYWP
ncbi:hypothetical protein GCM10025787_44170 [Saccharopolyspora rosea]